MTNENTDNRIALAPRLIEAGQRDATPTDYVAIINDDSAPPMIHPTQWLHAFPDQEAMLSAALEEICHYDLGEGVRDLECIPESLQSAISRIRDGSLDYIAAADAVNERSKGSFSIVWWGPVSALLTCQSEFAHALREEIEEEVTLESIASRLAGVNFA